MNVELQKIDCNCNDCKFMQRDLDRFRISENNHKISQMEVFARRKLRMEADARKYGRQNEPDKLQTLFDQARKMKFQFNRNAALLKFGHCQQFNKPVSFIPGVCQLHTQECFMHRKI